MASVSRPVIQAAGASFDVLTIRPGKQPQAKQQQMLSAIAPGTEVMTTAGIFGTIAVVTDEELSLEISPGVFMRILPAAVARVIEAPVDEIESSGDVD